MYGVPAHLCGTEFHERGHLYQGFQYGHHGTHRPPAGRTDGKENMAFPLHLGVTEAGDGEDGRIKSALGIGALLCDGLGDTIRVSLSEAPEAEIPVARNW